MITVLLLASTLQAMAMRWENLPPLPYRAPPAVTDQMSAFVGREVQMRRCPVAQARSVTVDVAVLVDEANGIRVAVPRAIRCPTVEQYAAALVASFARSNLLPRPGAGEMWYKTSVTFSWAE